MTAFKKIEFFFLRRLKFGLIILIFFLINPFFVDSELNSQEISKTLPTNSKLSENTSPLSQDSIDTIQSGTEIAFFDLSEVLLMENVESVADSTTHKNTITIRSSLSQDYFLVCLKLQDYERVIKIDVFNMIAKKVLEVYDGTAIKGEDCPDEYKIEAYNLPNGVYICIVQGKNLKLSGKFVISR
jgi:hypothetical protein